jgi:hypothetical protein
MHIPPSSFNSYINKTKSELSLLADFTLPSFVPWEIDWNAALEISKIPGKNKPWNKISEFNTLLENKDKPAIYFFTIQPEYSEQIFEFYQKAKAVSSKHGGGESNVELERHFNYSHVPKKYKGGNYIYVGSVKEGLHGRLIHHLGLGEKGETGALYLYQMIKSLPSQPLITFHYSFLNPQCTNVTKHIESVVYDELSPFIGKRALEDFTPYQIFPLPD